MKKLPRSFYLRPTIQVAQSLLGKHIVRRHRGKRLIGRIVEVEAYRGRLDPASHAFRGKTKRNEVMFFKGGHLYVYFTYGMHYCANVVTGPEGVGEAVLIRAVEPIRGIDVMLKNRFGTRKNSLRLLGRGARNSNPSHEQAHITLTNGPAKFCQAFGIGRNENGTDLLGHRISIVKAQNIRPSEIGVSTRIGVSRANEKRWRFFVKGSRWVSR